MNDRMTHDINCGSRFGPDRRLLVAGARHRLPSSSTDADNHMPGISGTEATQRICAAHPDLTVVLMSTYDLEDLPAGAAHCGAAANLHTESESGSADPVTASSPLRPILCC
jgi:hypothetical protein